MGLEGASIQSPHKPPKRPQNSHPSLQAKSETYSISMWKDNLSSQKLQKWPGAPQREQQSDREARRENSKLLTKAKIILASSKLHHRLKI